MSDLFIIEAPGKAKALTDMLKGLGFDAAVQATKGHLYSMPDKLTPVGIDKGFREFKRELRDPEVGRWIRDMASKADKVFIATDADQEGDVIAWDVAEIIQDLHPEPLRIRLKGMDEESVLEAINAPDPVRKSDAVAGRTRAIIDRMIGSTFSRDGVAVGRVGTALLGLVDQTAPTTGKLRLVAPAKNGGRPWTAECEIRPPLTEEIARKLSAVIFPALSASGATRNASSKPMNMGDLMVKAGDELDMSPKEASTSLQKLYEAGKMSYPRAGSRGISRGVLRKVAKALEKSGYKFEEDKIADKGARDVHDAPYPIGSVQVQRNPQMMGQQEGIRNLAGRGLVKSGQIHVIENAVGEKAAEHLKREGFSPTIAEFVGKLEWRRETGPRYPGQESWPDSQVSYRRADTALLEKAVSAGLGRPSTWANHIESFMNRGLVDEDLNLTEKGRHWISVSPPALLDPRISAAIENACEKTLPNMMDDPDREPWELLAEKITTLLPEEIRNPLLRCIEDTKPQPRPDPLAPYRETRGLEDLVKEAKEKTYSYGPLAPEAPSQ